jgi:CubicO group peptidase (beta-lactamase class C family)
MVGLATALIVIGAAFPARVAVGEHGAVAPTGDAPPGYPEQPAGVPFPTAEWTMGPLPAGVDGAVIDRGVEVAFGAPDATGRVQSVVVVQGGQIVYERYHPLDGPDEQYDSFSVAKSFTSALIGLLVADGRLELDAPAGVEEWQAPGDPRRAITLRQLLQMSSGLEWTEAYSGGSLVLQAITAPNAADFVAQLPLEFPPGTVWEYSTGTTMLLAGIAADELGGCQQSQDYLHERLLDPIGITTATLVEDASGCWFGGFGANMSTRDFARFGLLFLRGGTWEGQELLPVDWVDDSWTPAPTSAAYGLQWWIDSPQAFSARGLFGQLIYVVPSADLVVAINSTAGGDSGRLLQTVLAAFGLGALPPELPATR